MKVEAEENIEPLLGRGRKFETCIAHQNYLIKKHLDESLGAFLYQIQTTGLYDFSGPDKAARHASQYKQ